MVIKPVLGFSTNTLLTFWGTIRVRKMTTRVTLRTSMASMLVLMVTLMMQTINTVTLTGPVTEVYRIPSLPYRPESRSFACAGKLSSHLRHRQTSHLHHCHHHHRHHSNHHHHRHHHHHHLHPGNSLSWSDVFSYGDDIRRLQMNVSYFLGIYGASKVIRRYTGEIGKPKLFSFHPRGFND